MTLVALYLGVWVNCAHRYDAAARVLQRQGAYLCDGFEEPMGPNWIYLRMFNGVPGNDFFPRWFADWFCIRGNYQCYLNDVALEAKEWHLFKDLFGLEKISIENGKLEPGAISCLAECRDLVMLIISNTPLEQDDVDDLRTLKQIRSLDLGNTGLSNEQIDSLRASLPDCRIDDTSGID